MPKVSPVETRVGFLGGLNISAPSDMLNDDELVQCVNARIDSFGGIMRRPGSVILNAEFEDHSTNGPGDDILGVFQWGTDRQLVVVCSNNALYHSTAPYEIWVKVEATDASTFFSLADFATMREASPGAPLRLYIASSTVSKWDGATLTKITGVNSVPFATLIRPFGTRMFFGGSPSEPKKLYWSVIGDPEDCTPGGITGGGEAIVDVLTGDEMNGMEVVGSSLLFTTNESIARFTGTADDIQIHQGTQGVSATIGPSNPRGDAHGICVADQMVFLHSERGPYVATEGGAVSIGDKIQHPAQNSLRMSLGFGTGVITTNPIVGHNARRGEIWYAYKPIGGSRRDRVLVYNYKQQCWFGPFEYNFGITCFGPFEDDNGIESIMAGCDDGAVRLLDDPDNATSFDDGVTNFDCIVQFAPFGLRSGPRSTKALRRVFLQVVGDQTFNVQCTGDLGTTDTGVLII